VALVAGLGEASRLALEESGVLVLHLLGLKHRLISALLGGFSAEQVRGHRFSLAPIPFMLLVRRDSDCA
jgi:hypothetical protein